MSDISSSLGLSSVAMAIIIGNIVITVITLTLSILFFFRQRSIERKLELFFQGKDAKTLETILTEQLRETKSLDGDIQSLFDAVEQLRKLGQKSLHKHAVLRFNPFKEVGSNQSFSVALLDGNDSGVLISSLHTREGTRVYAKPVERGQDNGFPFTEEEKKVIRSAASTKTISS